MADQVPIQWESNSLPIYQPRFVDGKKTRVKALVRLPDGKLLEMEGQRGDKSSTFVRDVFLQYREEEIEAFTARERALEEARAKVLAQASEDRMLAEEREITFQAKAKALALPEVANCPDKRIGRKIRKARSAFEVGGWLAVAFLKSLEEENTLEKSGHSG